MDELIQGIFPETLSDAARASGTCRTFYRLFKRDVVARRLVLPDRPMRSESELVVLEGDRLRFSAPVERIIEGARDQDMTAGALSTRNRCVTFR